MSALILFDFDGTLADTAPDLAAAANRQRTRRGLAPLSADVLRPHASQGARGLLRAALSLQPGDPDYEPTRLQFLADYEAAMTEHTRLFDGIPELLDRLRSRGLDWGIVTNKVERLALPLVAHLGLASQCAALVCGDTTAHSKPHPEPLLHAARLAGHPPQRCMYVGDDLRDVQAGRAAGMPVIAAAYGYCGVDEAATAWQADRCVESPAELWAAIEALLPAGLGRAAVTV